MPYALRKAPGKNKYWVVDERNKKYSKDPISKEKAEAQRRALYASENRGGAAIDEFGNTKGLPAVKGHKSVLKNNADFLKAIEQEAQELFKQQGESLKQAIQILDGAKDKLEGRKDVIEQTRLEDAFEKVKREDAKIGSGIPNEKLAELLTLFSQKGKGKFSVQKVNAFLKKQLKGGKIKPCPEGYSDNKAGLCVENCKEDEQDIGLLCKKKCPPGHTDTGIECIEEGCPPDYVSTLLTCYKPPGGGQCQGGECSGGEVIVKESWYEPITCEGDPWKPVWEPGHQVCRGGLVHLRGCPSGYIDDGLLCRKPISCNPIKCADIIWADTKLKKRFGRDTRGKRMESNLDLRGTLAEIEDGLKVGFEIIGDELASKFDPNKNGVSDAFRKFGEDTKAAFEAIGDEVSSKFNKFLEDNPALRDGLNKFGNTMMDLWESSGAAATIGNEQWWKETMSDPHTYLTLVSLIAAGAATVLSAGTLGPASVAALMALQALEPATNIIADAAAGRPVDAMDFVSLGLALVPTGAAASAIVNNAALGVRAAKAMPYVARAAQVGQFVATAVKVGQTVGVVPKFPVINKPPPDVPIPGSKTGCDKENLRWSLGYKKVRDDDDGNETGDDLFTTSGCKKPNCSKEKWFAKDDDAVPPIKEGCQSEDPTTDPEELYKRASLKWAEGLSEHFDKMPDGADVVEYRKTYHLDPKDFPEGFAGWTEQYPEPACYYPNMISEETGRCLTEAEQEAELDEDEPDIRDPCYVLGTNTSDYNEPTMVGGADDFDFDDLFGGLDELEDEPAEIPDETPAETGEFTFDFDGLDDVDDFAFDFGDDEDEDCQPDSGIVNSDETMFGNYPLETFEQTAENQAQQENRMVEGRVRQDYAQKQQQNQLNNKQDEFLLLDILRMKANLQQILNSSITPADIKESFTYAVNAGEGERTYMTLDASMMTPELLTNELFKNASSDGFFEPPSNFLERMQEVSNLFTGTRSFTDEEKRNIAEGKLYYERLNQMTEGMRTTDRVLGPEWQSLGAEEVQRIQQEFDRRFQRNEELVPSILPEFNERAKQFIVDQKEEENALERQRREDEEINIMFEREEANRKFDENPIQIERNRLASLGIALSDKVITDLVNDKFGADAVAAFDKQRADFNESQKVVKEGEFQREEDDAELTKLIEEALAKEDADRTQRQAIRDAELNAQTAAEAERARRAQLPPEEKERLDLEDEYNRLIVNQPQWQQEQLANQKSEGIGGLRRAVQFMKGSGLVRRKSSRRRK
jgi:hypothetical protein